MVALGLLTYFFGALALTTSYVAVTRVNSPARIPMMIGKPDEDPTSARFLRFFGIGVSVLGASVIAGGADLSVGVVVLLVLGAFAPGTLIMFMHNRRIDSAHRPTSSTC